MQGDHSVAMLKRQAEARLRARGLSHSQAKRKVCAMDLPALRRAARATLLERLAGVLR